MNLRDLQMQYDLLKKTARTTKEKAARGIMFEKFLVNLFHCYGIFMTKSFALAGEQIDGAFEYKGWHYLVETKWQGRKQATNALYGFQGKPDRRIEGTRGLFISISGFQKVSLERFNQGRKPNVILWSGEHIESLLKGNITLKGLLDISVRIAAENGELLVDLKHLDVLSVKQNLKISEINDACVSQINEEIKINVGRKYIPNLYIETETNNKIWDLAFPLGNIQQELINLKQDCKHLSIEELEYLDNILRTYDNFYLSVLLKVKEECPNIKKTLFNINLKENLVTLCLKYLGKMHILLGPAGIGKTNLFCNLAMVCSKKCPTVLLTARSGINEDTSISELITRKLSKYTHIKVTFETLLESINNNNSQLIVFIDAINEHNNIGLLDTEIVRFLYEIGDKPVIVITSCRDVYWPFFEVSRWPQKQWEKLNNLFHNYSKPEFREARKLYFDYYKIKADLSEDAINKLSHPLILRFFCEAYGNPEFNSIVTLRPVVDVRLKKLFDDYLSRKLESIRHLSQNKKRTTTDIEDFLLIFADTLLEKKSRKLARTEIKNIHYNSNDLDSINSVYTLLLNEEIIIEERPDEYNHDINVVFTYDEFMEYIMAKSIIRNYNISNSLDIKKLIEKCLSESVFFPSYLGILEYLCLILQEDNNIVYWKYFENTSEEIILVSIRAISKIQYTDISCNEIQYLRKLFDFDYVTIREQAIAMMFIVAVGNRYEIKIRQKAFEHITVIFKDNKYMMHRHLLIDLFEFEERIREIGQHGEKFWSWLNCWKIKIEKSVIFLWYDDEAFETLIREELGNIGFSTCITYNQPNWRDYTPSLLILGDGYLRSLSGDELIAFLDSLRLDNINIILHTSISFEALLWNYKTRDFKSKLSAIISRESDQSIFLKTIILMSIGIFVE